MSISTIKSLYKAHLKAAFPASCCGRQVEGMDLMELDAAIAGCVQTFLSRRRLDPRRLCILGIGYRFAHVATRSGRPGARQYFSRLERLAGAVLLEFAGRHAGE